MQPRMRIRAEPVGQGAERLRVGLERIAHGPGKELEVLGRHCSVVRTDVDDDGCLAGELHLVGENVLAAEAALLDPGRRKPASGRLADRPNPVREHPHDGSSCVEGHDRQRKWRNRSPRRSRRRSARLTPSGSGAATVR